MNKETISCLCILLMLGIIQTLKAQTTEQKVKLQMELCDYQSAIKSYEDLIVKHPDNKEYPLQLAKAYYLNKNYAKAADWFEVAGYHEKLDKEDSELFINSLKASNKSISQDLFRNLTSEEFDIDQANVLNFSDIIIKSPIGEVSGKNAYNPILINEKLLFVSDESTNKDINNLRAHYGTLNYYNNKIARPAFNPMNPISNIGAFSKTDNKRCAFASHSSKKSGALATGCSKGSIFFGNLVNGIIEEIESFPYNALGVSNTDPFLNEDGTFMIYASDMPGGCGGMDLYISYLIDGKWTTPLNLGDEINTKGNEISPMVLGEKLYFASDFHPGYGGFDLFTAQRFENSWVLPNNLGEEINTPADECYPYASNTELYYSSNFGSDRFRIFSHPIQEKSFTQSVVSELSFRATPEDKGLNGSKSNNSDIEENIVALVSDFDNLYEISSSTKEKESANTTILEADSADLIANTQNTLISENEVIPEAMWLSDFSALDNKTLDLTLSGVKRVALAEYVPNNTMVYFIQLASLITNKANFKIYQNLLKFGNIYKFDIEGSAKIRLGYFIDRQEAERILAQVRKSGFKDAFIVREPINTTNMELVLTAHDINNNSTPAYNTTKNFQYSAPVSNYGASYKVRLASYEDPIWFDNSKVKDLGQIEQWSKGTWTIFILSGYNNFEQANQAKVKAINRGFKDAEVVIDNGGILERLKVN